MQDNRKQSLILCGIGVIPVVWLALLFAPTFGGGLAEMLPKWTAALSTPCHFIWCEDSLKTVLIFIVIYFFALLITITRSTIIASEKNTEAQSGAMRLP